MWLVASIASCILYLQWFLFDIHFSADSLGNNLVLSREIEWQCFYIFLWVYVIPLTQQTCHHILNSCQPADYEIMYHHHWEWFIIYHIQAVSKHLPSHAKANTVIVNTESFTAWHYNIVWAAEPSWFWARADTLLSHLMEA